ncbi:PH domain-containing protein [Tessaracoccus sp. MC1865]|uniref:PH domain-containing protein n=1 Tax=Tessaracoccus sp. MC1865 TaxID=2760310 RepID=UPI0015FF989E|nr:PH domain-containing protein [Tessaracoccus sp. MC1865]MBB1484144.1 PH domain-containing protein [Tessaracoccus sp. MC1865]QTO37171.1 PH domain-containing protein [Tessaracoccus sp. MC1865]
MNDLFDPPGTPWQRLSRNYLTQKLILIPLGWGFFFAFLAVPVLLWGTSWMRWSFFALAVVVIAWRMIRAPRVFRRWGYAERDEDVYLTRGLWSRSLQCVPYGRMQLVQVQSGPLDRLFGLATVQMITSSTSGTVTIPGLPAADAAALRDRLIARGEQQQAGI